MIGAAVAVEIPEGGGKKAAAEVGGIPGGGKEKATPFYRAGQFSGFQLFRIAGLQRRQLGFASLLAGGAGEGLDEAGVILGQGQIAKPLTSAFPLWVGG